VGEETSIPATPVKEGTQTSSFKIALVTALAPALLFVVIIVGLIYVDDLEVRAILIDALRYVVTPGIIVGGAVNWKFVDRRGDVSVAKVVAQQAIKSLLVKAATSDTDQQRGDNGAGVQTNRVD
jgi:hypothetical protein